MQRAIRYGAWAAIAALVLAIAVFFFTAREPARVASGAVFGGPFSLVDQKGRPVTEAALRGHPSVVFFGYTFCPDVCPTTLYDLTRRIEALGEKAGPLEVFFFTVDPERDTPQVMGAYVGNFSDRYTAVTGEPDAVRAALRGFGVYFKRVEGAGGYTLDHTASLFLLDGEGRLRSTIAYQEDEEVALRKLGNLLD